MTKYIFYALAVGVLLTSAASADAAAPGVTLTNVQVSVLESSSRFPARLKPGMSGDEVKALQKALAARPELYPEKLVTGYYGPLTARAVRRFQEKYELEPTGRADAATLAKLDKTLKSVPVLSFIRTDNVSSSTTRVSWETDEPATTVIYFGTTTLRSAAGTTWMAAGLSLTKSHAIDVNHLEPATAYYYSVASANAVGAMATSSVSSFMTENK